MKTPCSFQSHMLIVVASVMGVLGFFIVAWNLNFSSSPKEIIQDFVNTKFTKYKESSLQSYRLKLLERDQEIHHKLRERKRNEPMMMHNNVNNLMESSEESPFYITEPILKVLSEGKIEKKCQDLSNKNYKWMADYYDKLKSKQLNQIKIPGTHDSFTYSINFHNNNSALMYANDSPDELWKVFSVPFIPKTFMLMMMVPWANTQSCSVTEQLYHGIRYFDIRICKDDREVLENQFKICHNFYAGKIIEILNSVKDFVNNVAPSEFIILDFNHFYGMMQKDHDYLMKKITSEIGDIVIKSSQFQLTSTLESMWANTSRRVFIFYSDNYLKATGSDIAEYFHTNDNIEYTWAETLDPNYLNEYNVLKLKERSEATEEMATTLLNLQLVLTPDIVSVIKGFYTRPYSILDINEPLTKSIQQWIPSYNQSVLNIISCDYYHLYNFTEIVIQSNNN